MKPLAFILLCAVIGLGVLYVRQGTIVATQETQLAAMSAELSALKQQNKSVPFDLQVKCSEQAQKVFAQSGYKAEDMAMFQNHYNGKLNKCLIDTQYTSPRGKTIWTYRNVYDAVEGKPYGSYAWHTEDNKKYWEVKPVMCEVESTTGEKQLCHSEEEFSKLVQAYMAE